MDGLQLRDARGLNQNLPYFSDNAANSRARCLLGISRMFPMRGRGTGPGGKQLLVHRAETYLFATNTTAMPRAIQVPGMMRSTRGDAITTMRWTAVRPSGGLIYLSTLGSVYRERVERTDRLGVVMARGVRYIQSNLSRTAAGQVNRVR